MGRNCMKRDKNPIPCLKSCCDLGVSLTVEKFGLYQIAPDSVIAKPIKKFKWLNRNGMTVEVINYGATIVSISVPDRNGEFKDVVLGSDAIQDPANPYFGATIGRACNRIGQGVMVIEGRIYELSRNNLPNTLNGGFKGFDKVLWSACKEDKKITMSYHSEDGEEGFPGGLNVNITMFLTDGNEFVMEYRAFSTRPTYVNMTNHTYFNLSGHDGGAEELYQHHVTINAEHLIHTDKQMIPTGKLTPVGCTMFDFRIATSLKEKIDHDTGFDHDFSVCRSEHQRFNFVARVVHPSSGRVLEMYSDQPAVHFYTANEFPERTEQGLTGKNDCRYFKHAGFVLATQMYPDAVNHQEFPTAVLYPGKIYIHSLRYIFSVQHDDRFVPCRTSPLVSQT